MNGILIRSEPDSSISFLTAFTMLSQIPMKWGILRGFFYKTILCLGYNLNSLKLYANYR